MAWSDLRVRGLKDLFLSKGTRAPIMRPMDLLMTRGSDELYPRRTRLTLEFELPRGAYATLIVKRLTLLAGLPAEP